MVKKREDGETRVVRFLFGIAVGFAVCYYFSDMSIMFVESGMRDELIKGLEKL